MYNNKTYVHNAEILVYVVVQSSDLIPFSLFKCKIWNQGHNLDNLCKREFLQSA